MAKSSKSNSGYCMPGQPKAPTAYKDRAITSMKPAKAELLIPTPAAPISLHKRMAGGG